MIHVSVSIKLTCRSGKRSIAVLMVSHSTFAFSLRLYLKGNSSTAVGYQATTGDGKTEQPNAVIEALIAVVRPTGGLGIPGLYVPSDPGAPDSASAKYVCDHYAVSFDVVY